MQTAVLILAVVCSGLTAGLLFGWACAVMPGLARTDDRTFVGAFQARDRAIMNPYFLIAFVGALVLPGLATLLHLGVDHRRQLILTTVAFFLSVATIVITRVVHLPLNGAIQAAGDPARMTDPAAVRTRFEGRWVRWNLVRTATSIGAFACLVLALSA